MVETTVTIYVGAETPAKAAIDDGPPTPGL
jgi:hypothetical protein